MQVLTRVKPAELTGHKAIIASLIGAAFTAVCAQLAFHLPGNPVPVTMQVFAVLCCGLMLGSKVACLAQIEYIVAGCLGAPVFAGFMGGPAALIGPSGGYLIGFVVAAFVIGLVMESVLERNLKTACIAGMIGVGAIYAFGVAWLSVWLRIFDSSSVCWQSWALGVAPFVGIDAVKVVIAAKLFGKR